MTLSPASADTVTVGYETTDGSAVAGSDYTSKTGTLTFTSGATQRTITIATLEDAIDEPEETFTVTLGSPAGASLEDGSGLGTIEDDDDPPQVSVRDAPAVEEGDTAQFEVTLSRPSGKTVTVAYETGDDTAESGADYSAETGTLTFAVGITSQTIEVETLKDELDEQAETFTLTLSSPDGASLVGEPGTGTIEDEGSGTGTIEEENGDLAALSIADAEAVEEGSTARFVVTLSPESSEEVTVEYRTSDDTAEAGSDYVAVMGTLTFAAGTTSQTIEVETSVDDLDELEETFTVTLDSPDGASVDDGSGTGTIEDGADDTPPELSIADAEAVEEGATARFVVTLSPESGREVTVEYETSDDTAEAGSDYVAKMGTLTFTAGTTTQTIEVETSEDSLDELEETFTVTLDSPDGASVDDGSGTGTIEDGADDTPPAVSIADADAVEEGGTARFVVTLSPESGREVTVEYQTSDDTAEAGSDYVAKMGTLTFTVGTTTQTIEVETSEDDLDEANETFTVGLRDPEGATLNGDTGIGTITDDDDPPIVSIEDAMAVQEGGTALFEVTLNEASGREVTVMYRTVAGSALAESDYTAVSGQLTFEPGTLQQTVAVGTVDDGVSESEESFTVELHDPGEASVSTSRGTGTGTIIDNDELPVVSVADATPVSEGDAATFAVTLNEESGREVTVFFQTVDGTAIAGSDYASDSGTLTFSAGDMEQTITVSTLDDDAPEDPESFTVELSSPSGATVGKGVASGTIRDDDVSDPLSSLSIGDVESVDEGDTAEFTVTLTPASSRLATVSYETEDGTALAGSDYASVSGTLTFAANETAKTIQVSVLNDETRESSETFTMELRNPAGATLQDGSAVATIRDDDSDKLPSLSIDDAAAVDEPGTAEFLVRLSAPAGETGVRVDYGTVDGTALAGSDYRSEAGTLTFAANESTKTIRVSVLDDDTAEQVENFRVELENAVGATLLHRIGEGTINTNDPEETFSLLIRDAPAVPEGGTALFRVMLSASSDQDVSVTYETVDGTALSGTDYTPTRGTLSFGAGTTMLTIAVRTLDDGIREQSEAFTVELSDPVGAVLERASGTGTISDDDEEELPGLSIWDAPAVDEGDTAEFVATLSAASESEVTATYRTVDGTAQGGVDYESATGTLRFDAGVTEQTLSVSVLDDEMAESEESFSVELSNPQGATLEKSTATGTILDDDEDEVVPRGPSIAVADAAPVAEGGMAEFVVTLSTAGDETVSVSYSTADGTAIASADYESSAGTLEFAAGETSKTITVRTVDDEIREQDEEFMVELSNPQGARLVSSTGTGTILDDDEDRLPALSIADADAVGEGETAEFVVTLSAASDQEVSMSYRSVDGTAVAGSDYETVTGTLRFEAGVTEGTISVSVLDDASAEAEEHFTVKLGDASGATLEDDSGVGTIVDDDEDGVVPRGPTISVADATPVTEGGTAEFEVRLDRTSGAAVSVSYATRDGTAAAGSDYEASSGTLSFAPGESRKTISVATIEDEVPEGTERFTVRLSESQGATLESDTGTATIVDDDEDEIVDEPPPTLSIADAAPVDEGDTARFAVDLDRASDGEVTVSYSTMDGTAQAGADYASAAGTLTFVAGETAAHFTNVLIQSHILAGVKGSDCFRYLIDGKTLSAFGTRIGTGDLRAPPSRGNGSVGPCWSGRAEVVNGRSVQRSAVCARRSPRPDGLLHGPTEPLRLG